MEDDAKGRTEDVLKTRFEDLDKRLASTEKRIDDLKWFIGGITGLFTIVFGVVAVLGNLNFNNEKTELHRTATELKNDVKAALGASTARPQVDLLAPNRMPLDNQEIPAAFSRSSDGTLDLAIALFLRNSGDSTSGPMYIKIYTPDGLEFAGTSTDEPTFKYEFGHFPENLHPSEIPGGGYSFETTLWMRLKKKEQPAPGKYRTLAKIFYGKGQSSKATFLVVVK
jgi:hypothetical protein